MELTELRNKIDNIDKEILRLFRERMDVSTAVAEYKRIHSMPVFDKKREDEILQKFQGSEKVLWMDIMDISKAIQRQELYRGVGENSNKYFVPENARKIACQGIEGAYSENAADVIFSIPNANAGSNLNQVQNANAGLNLNQVQNANAGLNPNSNANPNQVQKIFFKEFEDVFDAVADGKVDYGVLPFDNSTTGTVDTVYDLIDKKGCFIVSSVKIKIEHCLCGKNARNLDSKTVYSHEQALKQCSEFLKNNNLRTIPCENTAASAKMAGEDENVLSVCSKACGEKYGLSVIAEDIANSKNNFTKFICISKEFETTEHANTIACTVTLPNTEGSLRRFLTVFHIAGCNLSSLKSRPIPDGSFDVRFHIDFEGNIFDVKTGSLIRDFLSNYKFKFLGNY
jgi:chorismate mutase/prephenate dehydratase